MSPVLRWASGLMRVPGDIPDAARWLLSFSLEEPECSAFDGWQIATLRRLRARRRYASGFIRVDAAEFAAVRNMLDLETLSTEPEEEDHDAAAAYVCSNAWCKWCMALRLRDRMDYWLDAHGHPRSPYIESAAHDVEADWLAVNAA